MLRRLLLASVGAITVSQSAAVAADLTPPPPPPPVFTWTGVYLGGQVGYAWSNGGSDYTILDPAHGIFTDTGRVGAFQGPIGGAHVGYDYQAGWWVIGLVGSIDGTSLRTSEVLYSPGFGAAYLSATERSDIQGSIRGRVGIT